jgi:ABC-2 type transport system permease protein
MSTSALGAVLLREGKIRATNFTLIFWDLLYPLGYLLVFGFAVNTTMGFTATLPGIEYNAFFLAGVLGMASFGIASNTSWSFFLDRDNGIFYEMLTYPLSRPQYLLGKVLFNIGVAVVQAFITVVLSAILFGVEIHAARVPLLLAATVVGTAGWFFFYAIFALRIRQNDVFNTVTSAFYFFFLFASSMFYPLEPLPRAFQLTAKVNPITWHVDVLRYATIGLGTGREVALEALAFLVFAAVAFAGALHSLERES